MLPNQWQFKPKSAANQLLDRDFCWVIAFVQRFELGKRKDEMARIIGLEAFITASWD